MFLIEVASRRVHLGGCTTHPDGAWVTQQARQVAWTVDERTDPVRCLIRDRDRTFTSGFDAVFEADNIRIVSDADSSTPGECIRRAVRQDRRSECLDWLLILNARHVERTLTVFIDHDNGWRPHRSLDLAPPKGGITLTMDAPRLRWHVSLMNVVSKLVRVFAFVSRAW